MKIFLFETMLVSQEMMKNYRKIQIKNFFRTILCHNDGTDIKPYILLILFKKSTIIAARYFTKQFFSVDFHHFLQKYPNSVKKNSHPIIHTDNN